jgi:hypothetical protein
MEKVEPNKTYIGIVEDNNDPKKMGRVKVRVVDVFDDIELDDIPWATPWKDLNGNYFNTPEKGKVLIIVFDQGDSNKPEFIFSDHYNINLENKLKSLSDDNYTTMKSLIFDHRTQIYVNEEEGLKLDHKYNNVNITEHTIDLNLKDNNRNVNIGDAAASQQAILGNHWMDWFDEFVDNLLGAKGGPFLGNLGAPVVPNPAFISILQKYKALRDPVFLSHHVNIVDNNKVTTVKNTEREDDPQLGDNWQSTVKENELTEKTDEDFKPKDGPKEEYNDEFVAPSTTDESDGVTDVSSVNDENKKDSIPKKEDLSKIESNPLIDKIVRFMQSKNYTVFEDIGVLNMVAMRTKDDGRVTNKFDDSLFVFWKKENGNWEIIDYPITSTPGFIPQTEILPENVAILALGQYIEQCKLGIFKGDEKYKCLKFEESTVYRNNKTTSYNYKAKTETGKFGIYIHRATDIGSSENVFNYSEGSQVFKSVVQYKQFINLCEKQINVANKETFTYTLVRKSEFDEFI